MKYTSFKTYDTKGLPALNIVMETDEGYAIEQRLFVDEVRHESLLRKWKDAYYVRRYVHLKSDTLNYVLHIIKKYKDAENEAKQDEETS